MKLVYQYMAIFFNFQPNSRLVVDEDDNGKFGTEKVKTKIHRLQVSINCNPQLQVDENYFCLILDQTFGKFGCLNRYFFPNNFNLIS